MARDPSISKCWVRWRPGARSAPRPARRRSWCRPGATARFRRSPLAARRRPARAPSAGCRRRGRTAGAGPPGAPAAGGRRDDARVGDATLVDLALPALEGRVPRHGPAPRVVVVAQRSADLVDAPVHLLDAGALEVGEPALVDGAVLAALRAGAVVGHHHDDGVVGVTQVVDEVEHPPDLLVGVGEEGGEALHEALGERPLLGVEAVPARDPGRARREHGALGDDALGQLAGEGLVAPAVPPLGEVALVALDPLGRRVVRRMAGPGGEVEEEGQLVVDGAQVAQELDGPVGQVGAEVVPVARPNAAGARRGCRGTAPGTNWCVSPPWKPYQRSKPRPSGHVARELAMLVSSSGLRCHFPTA